MAVRVRDALRLIWEFRNIMILFLVPIIASPLAILFNDGENPNVGRCAYCMVIIAVYWITEVIPLAVTSVLPVFLFPVLGVISAPEICSSYFKDTLMLFLGSLMVAVAVEKVNLHRRIALRALTLVGAEPRWLMIGIMVPTWFLSMWMSNTATTAMMIPIVSAILIQIKEIMDADEDLRAFESIVGKSSADKLQIKQQDILYEYGQITETPQAPETENSSVRDTTARTNVQKSESSEMDEMKEEGKIRQTPVSDGHIEVLPVPATEEIQYSDNNDGNPEFLNLAKCFSICTAYAANVGGITTLTGTPPNIVFKGQIDILYGTHDSGITFANWLVLGLPLSSVLLIITWFWLQLLFFPQGLIPCLKKGPRRDYSAVKWILRREYQSLGPISFAEIIVLLHFIVLALLWITRQPEFVDGWGALFKKGFVKDSTPAILISVALFVFPSSFPGMNSSRTVYISDKKPTYKYEPLLNWKIVNERLPWGVLLLMGGGFAVADAANKAGLSKWISSKLVVLGDMQPWLILLVLTLIVAGATEVTSNAATAQLLLPIVGDLAITLHLHPLYFMIPCVLATSFAFMLPVATPPNAIVFSTGYLKVRDMARSGFVMNILAVIMLNVAINTWGKVFFNLDTIPDVFLNTTQS